MEPPDIVIQKGGAKRSFPFQGDETLEIIPIGGEVASAAARGQIERGVW